MSNVMERRMDWTVEVEAYLIREIEAGHTAREVCAGLYKMTGVYPGRNAVIGKTHRLERAGRLTKPITPPRAVRSSGATDQWPVRKRNELITRWNAGDQDEAQIAAAMGISALSVKKKLACLRATGVDLRAVSAAPRARRQLSWPWDISVDRKITAMANAGAKPVRIAAYLNLPTEAVQQRVQAWNRRHEIAAQNEVPHPDPMIGADGQPGLTLLELPYLGACKFGTHLADVNGQARFCGRPSHGGGVYCPAHHARAYTTSRDQRYAMPKIAKENRGGRGMRARPILPELALSVRQPWAWAIIHGGKDIENRSWQAVNHGLKRRGPICIHASKGMTRREYESASDFMFSIGVQCPPPADLARGAIIGTVNVVDVVSDHVSPWFFGPRGLVMTDRKPCEIIPSSGALGFFKWSPAGELSVPSKWMNSGQRSGCGGDTADTDQGNMFAAWESVG